MRERARERNAEQVSTACGSGRVISRLESIWMIETCPA
jgi:hypothetical protein